MPKKNLRKKRENFSDSDSENTPIISNKEDLEATYVETEKGFVGFYIMSALLLCLSVGGAYWKRNSPAGRLMFVSLFLIVLFMLIAWLTWYYTTKKRRIENQTEANCEELLKMIEGKEDEVSNYVKKTCKSIKENNANATLTEFFLSKNSNDFMAYIVGMMSGFIFGLIDNGGLFAGMDALDPLFEGPANSIAGKGNFSLKENVKAGMGNTFSDALGSFLSVFIGKIFVTMSQKDETPMIADSIGLIIGCLVGFYVPAMLSKPKDSPAEKIEKLESEKAEKVKEYDDVIKSLGGSAIDKSDGKVNLPGTETVGDQSGAPVDASASSVPGTSNKYRYRLV